MQEISIFHACFSGIYETPGGEILREAHLDIEAFTMDRVTFTICYLTHFLLLEHLFIMRT